MASHASSSAIEVCGKKGGQLIRSFYAADIAYGGFKAVQKIVQKDATDCMLQFGSEGFNEYVKSAREVIDGKSMR